MKNVLVERFQQLAGIKPLYEYTENVYRIFFCPAHFGEDDTELFKANTEMIQNEFSKKAFGRKKKDVMCNVNGKPEYPGANVEGAEIYGSEEHSHEDKGNVAKENKDELVVRLNSEAYDLLKEKQDNAPGSQIVTDTMRLVNEKTIEHLHYFVRQVDTQTSTI